MLGGLELEEAVLVGSGCAENMKGVVVILDGGAFTATVVGKFDVVANEKPLPDAVARNGAPPNELAVATFEKRLPDGFAVAVSSKKVRAG